LYLFVWGIEKVESWYHGHKTAAWQWICSSLTIIKNSNMKNGIIALAVGVLLASCGNGNVNKSGATSEDQTADSTNINMGSQAPAGDTANQINYRGTTSPADSSNRNANDSVKGSDPASRKTTPGNESGQGGSKE
jgi:hypothetical protein